MGIYRAPSVPVVLLLTAISLGTEGSTTIQKSWNCGCSGVTYRLPNEGVSDDGVWAAGLPSPDATVADDLCMNSTGLVGEFTVIDSRTYDHQCLLNFRDYLYTEFNGSKPSNLWLHSPNSSCLYLSDSTSVPVSENCTTLPTPMGLICMKQTLASSCGAPPARLNGQWHLNGVCYNLSSCDAGHTLTSGGESSQCNGARWMPAILQCKAVDCGPSFQLINGFVSYPPLPLYQSMANVSCNQGYRLDGNTSITCLASGQWTRLGHCSSFIAIISAKPTPTTIALSWTAAGAPIFSDFPIFDPYYEVAYQAEGRAAQMLYTAATSQTISGLQFGTQYMITVTFFGGSDGATPTTQVNVTTTEDEPPPPLLSAAVSGRIISVNITTKPGRFFVARVCAVFRRLAVSRDTIFARSSVVLCNTTASSNSSRVTYVANQDQATYSILGFVANKAGVSGANSSPTTITTASALPSSSPTGLNVSSRGHDSVNLTWTNLPILDWNSDFTTFAIHYHAASSSLNHSRTTQFTDIHINFLTPGTQYVFYVAFVGSVGAGPAASVSTTTKDITDTRSSESAPALEIGGGIGIFFGALFLVALVAIPTSWVWRKRRDAAYGAVGKVHRSVRYSRGAELRRRPRPHPKRDEDGYELPVELLDVDYQAIDEEESPYGVLPILESVTIEDTATAGGRASADPKPDGTRQSVLPGIQIYGEVVAQRASAKVYGRQSRPLSVPLLTEPNTTVAWV